MSDDKTKMMGTPPDYEKAAEASDSASLPCSVAGVSGTNKFTYVNIVSKGCDGWLNLFFGGYCIGMVDDTELADMLRSVIEVEQ